MRIEPIRFRGTVPCYGLWQARQASPATPGPGTPYATSSVQH